MTTFRRAYALRFNYYASAMEVMISGKPPLGWTRRLTKRLSSQPFHISSPPNAAEQDLSAIQRQLAAVGQFRLYTLPIQLRLYAYHRLQWPSQHRVSQSSNEPSRPVKADATAQRGGSKNHLLRRPLRSSEAAAAGQFAQNSEGLGAARQVVRRQLTRLTRQLPLLSNKTADPLANAQRAVKAFVNGL